jgi:phosphoribosylanthranilate isomerase
VLNKTHLGKIKKVGIFVNHTFEQIRHLVELHGLELAQLHGQETPEEVESVSNFIEVIKAFPHTEIINTEYLMQYKSAKYFLFDTATKDHGGSGQQFDWKILAAYRAEKPFLIAGGIKADDIEELKKLNCIKYFAGVDINSKFEIAPGNKDLNKIQRFIKELRA